jgi:hypothetical protein
MTINGATATSRRVVNNVRFQAVAKLPSTAEIGADCVEKLSLEVASIN